MEKLFTFVACFLLFPDFIIQNVKYLYLSKYQQDTILVFREMGGANFL